VALLCAAPPTYMAGIIPYPYRPCPDFRYLTGVTQGGCAALIESAGPLGDSRHRFTLFVPDPDAEGERWDGEVMQPAAALEHFGADCATHVRDAGRVLEPALKAGGRLLCDWTRVHGRVRSFADPWRQQRELRGEMGSLREAVAESRWVKSPAEQGLLREGARVTTAAMRVAMRASVAGATEAKVAAAFEYECRNRGAQRMAYPPVVAGGADACTIHYLRNDKTLRDGDLLLMDAGCELHGYASDVTRTWPVSGRFSPEQRGVYEVVLAAYRECLALVR